MDDQVAVRIGHRFADIAKQPQSRRKIGAMGPAPRVDRLAGHIFHRHIRPPVGGDPAVDQPGNPRMLEPGKQAALAIEQLAVRGRFGAQQLDRHLLVEHPVAAVRGVDLAHPAAPDQVVDGETADDGAFGKRAVRAARGGFERRRRRTVQYPRMARGGEQRP